MLSILEQAYLVEEFSKFLLVLEGREIRSYIFNIMDKGSRLN